MMANHAGFVKLRYLGSRQLYGVPMAHYRLNVDGRRAVAGRGASPAMQRAMAHRFDYEMWLDRDQMIRKMGAAERAAPQLRDVRLGQAGARAAAEGGLAGRPTARRLITSGSAAPHVLAGALEVGGH